MILLMTPLAFAGTTKIYPTDDAYTDSSEPSRVFNNENLRAGNDLNFGIHRSYLKFDLSSLNGKTITSAKFSIDPIGSPVAPAETIFVLQLYSINSDSWNENNINWNNAPPLGNLIEEKVITNPNRIEFNILNQIEEQDRILSIGLKSNQESVSGSTGLYIVFFSNEDLQGQTYSPYIEVVYDGAGICTTDADTNSDGNISMSELLSYINGWKSGSVTMSNLLNAIGFWKTGVGC